MIGRKPSSLSFIEAASVPVIAVTAWQALYGIARIRPGDTVVVQGTGAVSVFVRPFQLTEMTRAVADELRADLRPGSDDSPIVQGMSSLTPRELEVLRHVIGGETNKETALALGISPRTVEVHRAAVMRKLGARNAAEMIRMAIKG